MVFFWNKGQHWFFYIYIFNLKQKTAFNQGLFEAKCLTAIAFMVFFSRFTVAAAAYEDDLYRAAPACLLYKCDLSLAQNSGY